jgi:hypothetical protein
LARQVNPGLKTGRVDEKIRKVMTRYDLADPGIDPVTRKNPVKNSVATR